MNTPEHQGELAIALGYHKAVAEHQRVLLQYRVWNSSRQMADNFTGAGARGLHLQPLLRLNLVKPAWADAMNCPRRHDDALLLCMSSEHHVTQL